MNGYLKETMKQTKHRKSWRDIPDEILLAGTATRSRDGHLVYPEMTRAESLNPSANTIWACLCGDERAAAIIMAWKFSFPVTTV
jgi:hypothetical protein